MKTKAVLYLCVVLSMVVSGCKSKTEPEETAPSASKQPSAEASAESVKPSVDEGETPAETAAQTRIAATVNGIEIAAEELERRMAAEQAKTAPAMPDSFKEQYTQTLREKILNELVYETLLAEKVREKRVVISNEDLQERMAQQCRARGMKLQDLQGMLNAQGRTLAEYQQQLRMEMAFERAIDAELDERIEVTDDEMKNYYMVHSDAFNTPATVHLQQIFLRMTPPDSPQAQKSTKDLADELLDRLRNKKQKFSELATMYSDSSLASSGGDMGFVEVTKLLPQLQEAIKTLENDQISDVIITRSGCYILKLIGRKAESSQPFEAVKEDVRRALATEKKKQIASQYLKELKEQATIIYQK